MKPSVYIETTIVSYLTARPSRDLVRAAHQQITREWWEESRPRFDCYISQAVIKEASAGDSTESAKRLVALREMPALLISDAAVELARQILLRRVLPRRATEDALHIAVAAAGGMDFLLTWNCRHIANAQIQVKIAEVCENGGLAFPVICTPEELVGE